MPALVRARRPSFDALARHTAQDHRAAAANARSGPTIRETYPELAALWQWLILKYSPDQPRVPAGNRDGGQWTRGERGSRNAPAAQSAAVVVERYDETKNPQIDQVTGILFQALLRAHLLVGEGAGPAYGIRVHTVFAADVKSQNIPGIDGNGVEQSFSLGDVVRFGLDGSIRTDVILRDESGKIIAVYDAKTGGARLSGARVKEIRAHLKIGPDVPIFELHVDRKIIAKLRILGYSASFASIIPAWKGILNVDADFCSFGQTTHIDLRVADSD